MRPISALVVACLVAALPSGVRAERPLSLFLLPALVDELAETLLPLRVSAEFDPNRGGRLWILESRYCGADAKGAGEFVAIAAPALVREDAALRGLRSEDCRRALLEVARASAAVRPSQDWVAAIALRAVWQSARLRWELIDGRAAGPSSREAPHFATATGSRAIAEFATSDARVTIDDQLDLTIQLAAAFSEDFVRISVARSPLGSIPKEGPPNRSGAPPSTRAIARLPNEAVNSILERDLVEQELVFEHKLSGRQRFSIRQASVASPDPETYALSGQSVHLNTDESFAIAVVFRGDDLRVESMALTQQLEDCGDSPPLSELEAWTVYTECMAELALRRGAAEVGSALLTETYQGRTLRPTGPPTPLQIWLDGQPFTGGVSILKASVEGDALALYLDPVLVRGGSRP